MRGLRTISAILRAAAGFDAEETRLLDVSDIVKMPMNAIRQRDEIKQRQIVDSDDFIGGPIVPKKLAGFWMSHMLLPMAGELPDMIVAAGSRLTSLS